MVHDQVIVPINFIIPSRRSTKVFRGPTLKVKLAWGYLEHGAEIFRNKIPDSFDVTFFFFFRWRYSPLWALACRTKPLHFSLSITKSLHLLTPSTWRSLSTPSLHLFLSLSSSSSRHYQFLREDILGILSSSILSWRPSQLILCPFIHFTIFSSLLSSSSSRFVLLFHSPSSYLGPYILLNIFLSKISRACSSLRCYRHIQIN
jgi:hypothetical protein